MRATADPAVNFTPPTGPDNWVVDPDIERGIRLANLAGWVFRYRWPASSAYARLVELEAGGWVIGESYFGTAIMIAPTWERAS